LIKDLLASFLPGQVAGIISQILCLGIAPLLLLAGFVEDITQTIRCEVVLTGKRIWIKASPYAWTPGQDIYLSDIKSLTFRRDAIFIRQHSSGKLQVHMLPDSRAIAKAYEQIKKEDK
jgi:hypothetical protein